MGLAETIVEALKKQASELVVKALVAKLPFLGSWLMNPIIGFVVSMVIDVLYDKGALAANFMWIAVENNAELKAAVKTKEVLEKLLAAGGDYKKAEQEFNDATDDLISHNFDHLPR